MFIFLSTKSILMRFKDEQCSIQYKSVHFFPGVGGGGVIDRGGGGKDYFKKKICCVNFISLNFTSVRTTLPLRSANLLYHPINENNLIRPPPPLRYIHENIVYKWMNIDCFYLCSINMLGCSWFPVYTT